MNQRQIDVQRIRCPDALDFDGEAFPAALACQSHNATPEDSVAWVHSQRDTLLDLTALHGAVLFRDFPIQTADDFDAFISAFELPNFAYQDSLSNAVRLNRTERVFTANEAPSDVTIFLHHEMAQTPVFPSRLFFFCEQPADSGGATPLCRSDLLYQRLRTDLPEFLDNCETYGLKYTNVMPPDDDPASGMGRSWRSTLRATTQEDAERRLGDLGYSFSWLPDGCLRATTPVLQAVRTLADGRRKSFFNQLIAAYLGWKDERNDPSSAIRLGNGEALRREDVLRAAELAEQCTYDLNWQRSDVALVDNFVVMHGRRSFTGSRQVLASLIAAADDR